MRSNNCPGAAVAVLKKGKVAHAKGYGLANVEHGVPVTRKTMFQLGSVGKQFTAALILLLERDGKVKLSDSVSQHLPEAKGKWDAASIEDLLCHQSGLPDMPYHDIDMRKDYTEEELLQLMLAEPIRESPRAKFRYSNGGYVTLGILAGRVGGKFYGDQLVERVLRPAGMKTARIISEEAIIPHRAAGYLPGPNKSLRNQTWVSPKLNTTADGSMYASLDDMIAWEQAMQAGKVLTRAEWDRCWKSRTTADGKDTGYGFGWVVASEGHHRLVAHTGQWQGFMAFIARERTTDTAVIIMVNKVGFQIESLGRKILEANVPGLKVTWLQPRVHSD